MLKYGKENTTSWKHHVYIFTKEILKAKILPIENL